MKGKILNVRGENVKKISENKEIAEIKKILGLETGKTYKNIEDVHKHLRYGKVLFMTDQDDDGSHIKGLGINLFQCEWGSLLEIPGFIGFMNTPILKARKGNQELVFYNNGEYESWKEIQVQNGSLEGWKIKYYKGLGTSTGKEFREYFEKKKIVGFEFLNETSTNIIDMVFNKKRSDDRKEWLGKYDRASYLDTNKTNVSYDDFINKELIHFSKYDCDRSIPNLMDGLKISLRKILYSAFKKKLTTEIKVAQFSGYVSEHSGYHHGEASLNAAIVGMAQNFVGSNNINLLVPSGQFGTRLQGGKDSASERYIFTYLNNLARIIYREDDDAILSYLDDDGFLVEPIFYAPIIPMILVNGTKGIGTGFSTDIMCYNPLDIIQYLKNKLIGISEEYDFVPYYDGFKGTIIKINTKVDTKSTDNDSVGSTKNSESCTKFLIKGKYEVVGVDKIRITELPIGSWTDDYKELLETMIDSVDKTGKKVTPIVKDYDDMSKDTSVDFIVTLTKGKLAELEAIKHEPGCNGIEKTFKLYTLNSTSNMNLFDAKDKLKKYTLVSDIIDDYYITRLEMYQTRKNYLIDTIEKCLIVLSNKTRYIKEILDDVIDLRKKSKTEVIKMLTERGYVLQLQNRSQSPESDLEKEHNSVNGFNYLIKMSMDSVTSENVDKLLKEYQSKQEELEKIKNKTIETMWSEELDELLEEYRKYKEIRENSMERRDMSSANKKVKKVIKTVKSSGGGKLEIE